MNDDLVIHIFLYHMHKCMRLNMCMNFPDATVKNDSCCVLRWPPGFSVSCYSLVTSTEEINSTDPNLKTWHKD